MINDGLGRYLAEKAEAQLRALAITIGALADAYAHTVDVNVSTGMRDVSSPASTVLIDTYRTLRAVEEMLVARMREINEALKRGEGET